MTKQEYIPTPKGPFVLFSMGLDGYEGERKMWNVPEKEIGVYHILVRMKHELTLSGQEFRLFGTKKPFLEPRRKFIEDYGRQPIDIFFTVNVKDLARLEDIEEPRPENLITSSRGWRRMVNVDTGQAKPIPKEIHTWGANSDRPCYGLAIAELQYFSPKQERYLRGKHLFYYLHDSPLTTWVRFTMGTLYVDLAKRSKTVRDRRILATAKLVYPYVYEIRKK
jgi:hypothetical protein